MAWTTPMTFVSSTPLTAAQLNVYLRDNLLETEAAKATSLGGIMVAEGLNAIIERVGGNQIIDVAEDTNSTSYTNVDTVGPIVTCVTGSRALIFISCEMSIDTSGVSANMGVEISGQTTLAASDTGSLQMDGMGSEDKPCRVGLFNFYDDLTPGTNTFTAKYKSLSGNWATFANRSLTVIPF